MFSCKNKDLFLHPCTSWTAITIKEQSGYAYFRRINVNRALFFFLGDRKRQEALVRKKTKNKENNTYCVIYVSLCVLYRQGK